MGVDERMKSQSVLAVLIGFYVSTLHGTPWIKTGTAALRRDRYLEGPEIVPVNAAVSRDKKESRTATAPSRWGGCLKRITDGSRNQEESRTATAALRWGGFLQNDAADSRDKNESRTATAPLRWGGFLQTRDKKESRTATAPSRWDGFLQNDAADSRDKKGSRTATAPLRWGGFLQNDAADSRDKKESRTATAADDVSCVECIRKGKVAAGFKKIAGKCPMRFCQCVN